MAQITITLTDDQQAALEAMYDTEDLQTVMQTVTVNQAENFILERIKEEEAKKDVATRKAAIDGFTIKPQTTE